MYENVPPQNDQKLNSRLLVTLWCLFVQGIFMTSMKNLDCISITQLSTLKNMSGAYLILWVLSLKMSKNVGSHTVILEYFNIKE